MRKPEYNVLIFFLSGLILFVSCNVTDSDEFTDTFSYQINEQSVIRTDTMQRPAGPDSTVNVLTFDVVPGDHTIFRYEHNVIASPGIADGDFFETLVFQIPPGIDQFEFRKGDFVEAKALYLRGCFCQLSGAAFNVTSGVIRGEQLSPIHWIVRADVTVESVIGTFNVRFEEPFYVE